MIPVFNTYKLRTKLSRKSEQIRFKRMQILARALSRPITKKTTIQQSDDDGINWSSIEYIPVRNDWVEGSEILGDLNVPNIREVFINLIQQDYRPEALSFMLSNHASSHSALTNDDFVDILHPDFTYDFDDFNEMYNDWVFVYEIDEGVSASLMQKPNGDQYLYFIHQGYLFGSIRTVDGDMSDKDFVLLGDNLIDYKIDKKIGTTWIQYLRLGIYGESDLYEKELVWLPCDEPYDSVIPENRSMLRALKDTQPLDVQVSFGDGTDIDFGSSFLTYEEIYDIGTIQITGQGEYYDLKKVLDEMWKLGLYEKMVNK